MHAHTFLSAAALLYVLHARLSVAVVSAAQRELPSIRPSDLPSVSTHTHTGEQREPAAAPAGIDLLAVVQRSAGSHRRRSTLQFLSARVSGSSDPAAE